MDSRRVKTAPGQNVMHQVAVDTAVAIREWVDIHESEGKHGCGNYRVHLLFGAAVERNHALNKGWQILGPRRSPGPSAVCGPAAGARPQSRNSTLSLSAAGTPPFAREDRAARH